MSVLTKNLLDYIDHVEEKHNIPRTVLAEIFTNLPGADFNDYQLAFAVEKKLELKKGYFSRALNRNYEIKATIEKHHDHIYVKLDDEIVKLLNNGYVAAKIRPDEINDYEIVLNLTKNTILGFWK